MIQDLASKNTDVLISVIVFGITFFLFIGWFIWSNIISKKYIKHCEDLTKNDE